MFLVKCIRTILNGSVGLQRDTFMSVNTIAEALKEIGVQKLVA